MNPNREKGWSPSGTATVATWLPSSDGTSGVTSAFPASLVDSEASAICSPTSTSPPDPRRVHHRSDTPLSASQSSSPRHTRTVISLHARVSSTLTRTTSPRLPTIWYVCMLSTRAVRPSLVARGGPGRRRRCIKGAKGCERRGSSGLGRARRRGGSRGAWAGVGPLLGPCRRSDPLQQGLSPLDRNAWEAIAAPQASRARAT